MTWHIRGWEVTPIFEEKEAHELAEIVRQEALAMVFGDNIPNIPEPELLLTDAALRAQHNIDPEVVWHRGNSRQPKISKSCGMVNVYHNPMIRDRCLFNPRVIETIRGLYRLLPESTDDERLVYMNGPDRLGFKPINADHMPRHIDSNFCLPIKEQHPRYRVQGVLTLQITPGKYNGSVEVLEGFHHYFELFGIYCGQMKYPPLKGEGFHRLEGSVYLKALPAFITYLHKEIYTLPVVNGTLFTPNPVLNDIVKTLPLNYVPIIWVKPEVKSGDLVCFDSRLPHRNTANKVGNRIVAYISLYRHADWMRKGSPNIVEMFEGGAKSAYNHHIIDDERRIFGKEWEDRTRLDLDPPHIREVLGL